MFYAPQINPVIFGNPLNIRWYSLMYVLGLLAVYINFRKALGAKRIQASLDQIETLIVISLLSMILGARLFYIIFYNMDYFLGNPLEMLYVWQGGLSFHGAMLGVCVGIYGFTKYTGLSFWECTDEIATVIPIGLGLGRIGNFINGELWGRLSDMPWAMVFHEGGPLARHPSQLYEALLEGVCLLWIMQQLKKTPHPKGYLSGMFVCSYSLVRFFAEYFRQPDPQIGFIWGIFTMGQLLCAVMLGIGLATVMAVTHPKKTG